MKSSEQMFEELWCESLKERKYKNELQRDLEKIQARYMFQMGVNASLSILTELTKKYEAVGDFEKLFVCREFLTVFIDFKGHSRTK